ncbi:MAG: hypothetical protein J6K17_07780 [Oscillospiraceae bacterium]|nr:hypothetical protein [Oscillospiraceae bacterium]
MSEMLRVTSPVAPKDYNLNQNVKPQTPEQVFNLGNVDYINKTNVRDEHLGEQNLKDGSGAGMPKLNASFSKDPALSAVLLKSIISGGAMSVIGASGDAELLNKVTEFANEVLLSPDELTDDIIRQQDESTMFSGKLWGALKDMIAGLSGSSVSEEVSSAVLDFLKAAAAANSRDDILASISASLRFLAGETAQSKQLADLLLQTADKLNAENFGTVKNDILALVNYLEKSLLLNDKTQNLLSLITYNLSRFNGDASALGESFNSLLNMAPDSATADKLNSLFAQFIENSNLPADIKLAALKGNPSAAAQRSMTMLTERLADALNDSLNGIAPDKLSEMLSGINEKGGTATLREILSQLLPNNMKGGLNTLLRGFEHTKDLNNLIDQLSVMINRVDNMDNKITLAQSINLILTEMAQANGVDYKPPTTMENMLDFLIKNINDPSLKSLSAMGRPEMLQGLLSAPGVFTPLLHFLVPINMDDMKAFGELWVDPDAGNDPETGSSDNHLFLCFDIEEAGYFELEIYTRGKSVNVALLCPEGTQRDYLPLKETIPTLASACGYNAEKMIVEPLKRRRDLTNVFPKLNERRSGLNVSV